MNYGLKPVLLAVAKRGSTLYSRHEWMQRLIQRVSEGAILPGAGDNTLHLFVFSLKDGGGRHELSVPF